MMDGIAELAKILKERTNQLYLGPQIGKVLSPTPNIQIKLGDKITLTKDHLVCASVINTIISGDEVILIPTTDEQKYFLIDKVVKL